MKKTMLLTLFLAFLFAAMLQVRLTAKPQTVTEEPPVTETVTNATTEETPPALDAETQRLLTLAESMVTLPDVTVVRLLDVADDLVLARSRSDRFHRESWEQIDRMRIKLFDKVISLKPDADILFNVYSSKWFTLISLSLALC